MPPIEGILRVDPVPPPPPLVENPNFTELDKEDKEREK